MTVALIVLSVLAILSTLFIWRLAHVNKHPEVEVAEAKQKPRILWRRRSDVITAYFAQDLPKEGMVAPREGMMVFTDRDGLPRTGTAEQLQQVAKATDCELVEVGPYYLYAIGTGGFGATVEEDVRVYGSFVVPNLAAAIARGNQYVMRTWGMDDEFIKSDHGPIVAIAFS